MRREGHARSLPPVDPPTRGRCPGVGARPKTSLHIPRRHPEADFAFDEGIACYLPFLARDGLATFAVRLRPALENRRPAPALAPLACSARPLVEPLARIGTPALAPRLHSPWACRVAWRCSLSIGMLASSWGVTQFPHRRCRDYGSMYTPTTTHRRNSSEGAIADAVVRPYVWDSPKAGLSRLTAPELHRA